MPDVDVTFAAIRTARARADEATRQAAASAYSVPEAHAKMLGVCSRGAAALVDNGVVNGAGTSVDLRDRYLTEVNAPGADRMLVERLYRRIEACRLAVRLAQAGWVFPCRDSFCSAHASEAAEVETACPVKE